ncbi:MAG: MFS transporter [Sphaerochaetaceae bacterium]|nr:MFS transporter [Sphaerochaetaceae bacterium]MDD3163090.1 MFS transporter [Sphaerochaetaceae bacterium]MDD4007708.1 MFS transporter [Sphaerochaetaceae bacterium]MDD4397005.1 MFS transporter [Sphaerochaetaceae bacterium]
MTRTRRIDWALMWILGIAGQLCWNVENSWFNTFVYNKISPDPSIVSWMIGTSAAVTAFSTFFFGTWSDRIGRRKPFLVLGYILWGLFTVLFGIGQFIPKSHMLAAVVFCVACDAIMSFFGSMGYDCAFCSWTTDISNEGNRGQVGGVFAALPVIATIIGTVVSGMIVDSLGFFPFFIIMGVMVAASAVFASFAMKEKPVEPNIDPRGFWHQMGSVFDFQTVKNNKELFWVFLILMAYFIGFNIYYPYITIYFVNFLGYSYTSSGLIQGGGLIAAVILTLPASKLVNRNKNSEVISASILLSLAGVLVLSFTSGSVWTTVGAFFTGLGYVLIFQTLTAWMKNLFPSGSRGQFEGVKIVFFVLIPMIISPLISNFVIDRYGVSMVIEGVQGMVPDQSLLLAAGAFMLLTFLPLVPASRILRARLSD